MRKRDDDFISPNDPAASAFADAARTYCDFIDAAVVERPDPLYEPLQGLLFRLAHLVEPLHCYAPNLKKRLEKKFDALTDEIPTPPGSIHDFVGSDSDQLIAWAEHDADGHSRRLVLFDDLADIYIDLRRGLLLWDLHSPPACSEAVYIWRWGYEHHWGYHFFSAMQTIHEMRFGLLRD